MHGGNVLKLLLLLRATIRNYYRRDRSGTAAGPQRDRGETAKCGNSHDSRLEAGPVPPSAGPLYLGIYRSGTAYPVWEL